MEVKFATQVKFPMEVKFAAQVKFAFGKLWYSLRNELKLRMASCVDAILFS